MRVARIPPYVRALAAALPLAVAWTCSSSQEAPGAWVELVGEVGGGGPGGAPPLPTSSSSGEGGGVGGGGVGGSAGAGGAPCDDQGAGEPNETEATAAFLETITDDDDTGGTLSGTLIGPGDIDWYWYSGVDIALYSVNPTRTFSDGLGRVCKFAQCASGGATEVTCLDGATTAQSPTGRPGCCDIGTFGMEIDCPGTSDDDATVYIRVDQSSSDCVAYSIDYHY